MNNLSDFLVSPEARIVNFPDDSPAEGGIKHT